MTRPGDRLRALAARVCSARTMERLIDPLVADLQTEYAAAIRQRRVWKGRWVRMAGYAAFLKVIAVCACEEPMRMFRGWTADDRQAIARTIGYSLSGILVVTLLAELPYWLSVQTTPSPTHTLQEVQQRHLAYLVIRALPLALPVGLMLGILYGLSGRIFSARVTTTILALAIAASAGSFVTMGWILPSASHAYRVSRVGRDAADFMKSPGQMTLDELGQQIDHYHIKQMAGSRVVRDLTLAYHRRWALSCTALVFALFALSLQPGRRFARVSPFGVPVAVCLGYSVLLWAGQTGNLPVIVAAWIPNVVFALGAVAFLAAASRRSKLTV
jgi:hypothetical protein